MPDTTFGVLPPAEALQIEAVTVADLSRSDLFRQLRQALDGGARIRLGFCNANMLLKALRSPAYAAALKPLLLVSDGLGIDLCSLLFRGRAFRANLNGTDLVPAFLASETGGRTLFLLGGRPGIAEAAARNLARRYPQHRVVGTRHGYFAAEETAGIVAAIDAASPDILLVALGNPQQEIFIAEQAQRIDARVMMGVGALLDYTAGASVRAPALLRLVRLEWLFRLLREPGRLGRRYTVEAAQFLATIVRLRIVALARSRRAPARDAHGSAAQAHGRAAPHH